MRCPKPSIAAVKEKKSGGFLPLEIAPIFPSWVGTLKIQDPLRNPPLLRITIRHQTCPLDPKCVKIFKQWSHHQTVKKKRRRAEFRLVGTVCLIWYCVSKTLFGGKTNIFSVEIKWYRRCVKVSVTTSNFSYSIFRCNSEKNLIRERDVASVINWKEWLFLGKNLKVWIIPYYPKWFGKSHKHKLKEWNFMFGLIYWKFKPLKMNTIYMHGQLLNFTSIAVYSRVKLTIRWNVNNKINTILYITKHIY